MRLEKHLALVLQSRPTGEADLYVWALNSEGNQVRFVAKGARKTMSRFAAMVQPFIFAEFVLYRGPGIPILRQASCLETFSGIRNNHTKCLPAFSALELCRLLIAEEGGEREAFALTISYFKYLNVHAFSVTALNAYRLRLAQTLGYAPVWDSCVLCGTAAGRGIADWNAGGLVCLNCSGEGVTITPDILAIIRFLDKFGFAGADKLTAGPLQLSRVSLIVEDLFIFLTEGKTKTQASTFWGGKLDH